MKILLAIDDSKYARAAVDFLICFPLSEKSEITLLTVIEDDLFIRKCKKEPCHDQGIALLKTEYFVQAEQRRLLKEESDRLSQAGLIVNCEVRVGHPAEVITEIAQKSGTDLVVVGSSRQGCVKRFLLGTAYDYILEYSPCSVLVVKKPDASLLQSVEALPSSSVERGKPGLHVLLAYDDSEQAKKSVELCASLPLDGNTKITALTVLPLVTCYRHDILQRLGRVWHEKKRAAGQSLRRISEEMRRTTPNVSSQLRESEDVSQEILKTADDLNCELIMLGYKSKSTIQKLLMGSVTKRIAHHAPCSVLLVR